MPRGGARPGAGRKPKGKNVVTFPGGEPTSAPDSPGAAASADAAAIASSLLEPPADLPEAQQDVWRRYAPLAIEQRTLVGATVPGFRELCELLAFKEDLADRIAKYGAEGERMKSYAKLSPRVDAALARFKLTAFGKPADGSSQKKPAANPWAQIS